MSSRAETERVNSLLVKADSFLQDDKLQQAAEALREASRLDAQNAQVKEKWLALQKHDGQPKDVVELLRVSIASNDATDGENALRALQTKSLSETEATQAVQLLLSTKKDADILNVLTSKLLTLHVEARKAVVAKLSTSLTELFENAFTRGDDAFSAFTAIPLEDPLWDDEENQATVQRDVFLLCIATMIGPGAEHLERLMKSTARLLATVPDNLAPVVDADVFDAILSSLTIRLPASLRREATLATAKLLDATKERGEKLFTDFVTQRAARQTNDDLIRVFSAAAAVFPFIPAVAARLFLLDGFVQQLVPNLERNSEAGQVRMMKSHTLETAALELLSAACVDASCREAIKRYCLPWLESLSEDANNALKAVAALVLAKLDVDPADQVTAKLERLVLAGGSEADPAIEGLAYTSLQPSVKEEIANNEALLKRLVFALKEQPVAMYGCLTTFANLTAYRPNLSEEQKKMKQLKAYANSSVPVPDDPLDDAEKVNARCRKVLDANIVPALVDCCKQTISPTNLSVATNILLALAHQQAHRAKMAQQGAVRLLLQIQSRMPKSKDTTKDGSGVDRSAAHALSRLLISLNPDHTFSSALPASNAVSTLAPLLSQDQDEEHRDLLPTFEALLALTNLASMQDNKIRDLELRLVWSQIEDHLLLSSNKLVQRASMELVCNLMASPTCVAKFVGDGSKREATRMQILLALTDVDDLPTRRAATGALAMLTEWDAAVTAIINQNKGSGPNGVKALLSACADHSDEVKHRGLVCVANVVNAPGDVGPRGVEAVKQNNGRGILQDAMKKTKNQEIADIAAEVLKKLV